MKELCPNWELRSKHDAVTETEERAVRAEERANQEAQRANKAEERANQEAERANKAEEQVDNLNDLVKFLRADLKAKRQRDDANDELHDDAARPGKRFRS